jgi:hypothetical protein
MTARLRRRIHMLVPALLTAAAIGVGCGSSNSNGPSGAAGTGGGAGPARGGAGGSGVAGAAGGAAGSMVGSGGAAGGSAGAAGGAAGSTAGSGGAAGGSAGAAGGTAGTGVVCGNDLSNVGTGDFTISLTLTTTAMNSTGHAGTLLGETAVIDQRSTCNSSAPFWDIRAGLPPTGSPANAFWIDIETNDTTADDSTGNMVVLNDGVPHMVVVTRISGTMRVSVDGVAGTPVPSTSNFGALAPLAKGTDVCDGVDGTVPLVGTVTNVCISQ